MLAHNSSIVNLKMAGNSIQENGALALALGWVLMCVLM